MTYTGQSSIPEEVLAKIECNRPYLAGIVRNCRRSDFGRRFDKPLADACLIGDCRLDINEVMDLSHCCVGDEYGRTRPSGG